MAPRVDLAFSTSAAVLDWAGREDERENEEDDEEGLDGVVVGEPAQGCWWAVRRGGRGGDVPGDKDARHRLEEVESTKDDPVGKPLGVTAANVSVSTLSLSHTASSPTRRLSRPSSIRGVRAQDSLVVSRGLEGLQREVRWESPAEEVGEEAGKDVEEDQRGKDSGEPEDSVSLGDLDLLLELVESGVLGELWGEGGRRGRGINR